MIQKLKEKEKSIKLRKKGYSYSEILKRVHVAKSTLSLWLRSVGLTKRKKQRLTWKKFLGAQKGALIKKEKRIVLTKEIKNKARKQIGKISKRELWLIGIALYWAEGAKQKEHNVSQRVKFSNSNPMAVKLFLRWLQEICGISKKDIYFQISVHKTAKNRLNEIKKYWADVTRFPEDKFQKIYWKKHKIRTNRKNTGKEYFGLLNISVRKSTNFNRKIEGWIEGICKNCGVV